jgi:cell division protein FtsI (penicillin-binding protein 3)
MTGQPRTRPRPADRQPPRIAPKPKPKPSARPQPRAKTPPKRAPWVEARRRRAAAAAKARSRGNKPAERRLIASRTRKTPRRRVPARAYKAGNHQARLVCLLVVVCLAFVAVAVRVAQLQIFPDDRTVGLAQSQRMRTAELPAQRGAIFDRNGRDLALSISRRTVWANPRLVSDPIGEARALAPVLGLTEAEVLDRLRRDAAFVYLSRKVDDPVADQVAAMKLDGVFLLEEPKRIAPAGELARPLLGNVGLDDDGLAGLELQYNKQLTGTPGELRVERDPNGNEIASGHREFVAPKRGEDLVLTIDRSLQYEVERALAAQIVSANAKGGIAIVMEPATGEILAMANFSGAPGTNPRPAANNMAITNVYEPGSVNKIITVAAGIEEGLVTPATMMKVPDHLKVADHVFHDHDPHPVERWSVTDVLATSSNIGTIMIGQKLGKERLDRYIRAFGLGRETGLDFPGESAGLLLEPKHWSGTSIGTIPIGQGVAVTAVQMLGAYNTVANGGLWVEPRLVRETVDSRGRRHPAPQPERRRVLSSQTAEQVSAMLAEVVTAGTGSEARIEGYTVAGKTGTARKPLPTGGYGRPGQYRYVATFAGFVPAESPRLSAIVILDEPTPIYGGLVAAPVFAQISRYALRHLHIPPAAPAKVTGVPEVAVEGVRADREFDNADAPVIAAPATTVPPVTSTTTKPGE